ncbi:MAG: hypothetical protein NC397_00335 [Clostridium sp.]|nr:hypothetical protein [Clostridium sp.]
MANSKKEKVNKNPDTIRKDVAAIIFVLVIIAIYIFVECYGAMHVDVETITAVTSTVYDSVEAKALVVRDEHTIPAGNSVTVACADNGEKVKLNGNIAMEFSSVESARNYSLLQDLHSELDYYNELESKSAGIATDVESIDKDIMNDVNNYIRTANNSTADKLSAYTDDLNDKLTRRQMIIGQSIDFSSVKSDLQNQINSINADSCKPIGTVTAEESGVFSSYTDGLETAFNYSDITSIDIDTLNKYIEMASNNDKAQASFGKLITSYEWYFCTVVSCDTVKGISNGDTLEVAIKDSEEVIRCKVVSGADTDLGAEETVLILSSSQMDGEITSMRLEDIEIRHNEYTGFKVPASAVHIDEDGKKCVYALVANQVSKRYGEIIYSSKDFVVMAYDADNKDSIRYYDQIITKGKDLHDGKVYT